MSPLKMGSPSEAERREDNSYIGQDHGKLGFTESAAGMTRAFSHTILNLGTLSGHPKLEKCKRSAVGSQRRMPKTSSRTDVESFGKDIHDAE
jgi:hypothetical protein